MSAPSRTLSCDEAISRPIHPSVSETGEEEVGWLSDYTNSDEDEPFSEHVTHFTDHVSNIFVSRVMN